MKRRYELARYQQGLFEPKFPEKWIIPKTSITGGSYIRYMSSYEKKAFKFLDLNPGIEKISSEPFGIHYESPVDGKIHRYFPDLLVKTKAGRKFLVEIKPYDQTIPPKQPKRLTTKSQENYIKALETFQINTNKWKAAREFCEKNNLEFIILTEKELQI